MPMIPRAHNSVFLVVWLQLNGCGRTELLSEVGALVECNARCQACGNSSLDDGEQCDDGNASNGDGCSSRCQWEPVGIACGEAHTCAIGATGKLLCWGNNAFGQLGQGDTATRGDDPNELGSHLPTVDIGTNGQVLAVAASWSTCAILEDAKLKCWGRNDSGQLGLGDQNDRGNGPGEMGEALPAVDLGVAVRVRSVAVDGAVTCALLDDGRAKCWGTSMQGQLGMGTISRSGAQPGEMGDNLDYWALGSGRTVRLLALSREGSVACAILDDDSLKCWGDGHSGALGLEDRENRGDQSGEMGDNLPNVRIGTGQRAVALAIGLAHTCAILGGGSVKCWGNNPNGELGLGDHRSRGVEPGDMGDALPFVNLGKGRHAVSLAASAYSTCALFEDGDVKCWGANLSAQLGLGDGYPRGEFSADMGDNLDTVELGTGRTAKSICAGNVHVCSLLDNGTIKCWGQNVVGQLGIGTSGFDGHYDYGPKSYIGDEPGEMGDNLATVELRF